MNEYLRTQDGLDSEESLIAERQKVQAVIARLILKDHVLLITEDATTADERVLVVHPNYTVESNSTTFKKQI